MLEYISENWFLLIVAVAGIVVIARDAYQFFKLDPQSQKEKVQEWLVWAVTQAERELGQKTGQLKLRRVYEMFVASFPWMVEKIGFKEFSDMVDVALGKMRKMLEDNKAVQGYVEGEQK